MSTPNLLLEQQALPGLCEVTEAVNVLAHASEADERGAIFTRREVVEFILDLTGYSAGQPLHTKALLEPSFGGGDFLLPAIDGLMTAWKRAPARGKGKPPPLDACIRAVELHKASFDTTRRQVVELLQRHGVVEAEALRLADLWLLQSDFLLAPLPDGFDFVVGNPPYVRQELIPGALLREYRRRYSTLYDRADLYIPFIERSLRLLSPRGALGFICADRWMKNRYGGPLRALVASEYHLRAYVDMVDTPAFHAEVIAYPAITVIARQRSDVTVVAARPKIDAAALRKLAKALRADSDRVQPGVQRIRNVAKGSEPWVLSASPATGLVRRVEAEFPLLEEVGCKVGIGVATGADQVFVGRYDELDVEADRKLPLAMTRDIASGVVAWRGYGVINPFEDSGALVDLKSHPRLRAYLERHRAAVTGRHVAQKDSARWYRTIDRITPALASRPKLLIPDIKGDAQVVYEDGRLYPHHNLYYVVSDSWDLRALQAVLLSELTRLFVATYSTKMRGGFLRFQAQYLRRIRVPRWEDVAAPMRQRLADAASALDITACNLAVAELYGLSKAEVEAVGKSELGSDTQHGQLSTAGA